MALVPLPGNHCAIRLVAAAVLASGGSSAEAVSPGFACVSARTTFAITAAAIQAATTSRGASRDRLWLSSPGTLAIVLTSVSGHDVFTRMYQFWG